MTSDVIVEYETGFPTRLSGRARLARMLREHGAPLRIRSLASGRRLIEWSPIFPGPPAPEYILPAPFKGDDRRIVRVRLAPDPAPGPSLPRP